MSAAGSIILAALLFCIRVATAAPTFHEGDHAHLIGPFGVDPGLDCATRNFTYAYANTLLPSRAPLVSVFDALRLAADCNQTRPSAPPAPPPPFYSPGGGTTILRTLALTAGAFFVDAAHGSDSNSGTEASPFATPVRALQATRAAGGGGHIVLRDSAPFYLESPIVLTPRDSGLTLSAYPGEAPVLSGGAALSALAWVRVGPSPNASVSATIWRADLSSQAAALLKMPFSSLFAPTGRRAVRARWPNGNPEDLSGLMPNGYTKAAKWLPPLTPTTPQVWVAPQVDPLTEPRSACPADACTPQGHPSVAGPPWAIFCCFFWGWNGTAENYTRGSYWGTVPGSPGGETVRTPGGLVAGADLLPRLAAWQRPEQALVHAFHGAYWGNWMFSVRAVNASSGEVAFRDGGWQEARGDGAGDYLYIENVREELDAPGEWYVDGAARQLYYCANGTTDDAPPSGEGWAAGQLNNLVTLAGTPAAPVEDITLAGLTLTHTEPTFMNHFSASGGGDWSFQDGGALRMVGTRNCRVSGSLFVNLGGNGVMVSGWNRGAAVTDSEFLWMGENAVVSAGDPSRHDNSAPDAPVGDGLLLARNLAHELGVFVKQAGFLYQTMSANTTIVANVMFNGPRAGVNLNDGFGGGHNVSHNAAFNLVRETSDHGPFNSWDRNTYRWREGEGGTDQLVSHIHANLWVANYYAVVPIDHDDGSNGYVDTSNVMLWGGTKTLMGYNKHNIGNAMVYVDYNPQLHAPAARRVGWSAPESKPSMCSGFIVPTPTLPGKYEVWQNNTCIATDPVHFFRWFNCNASNVSNGAIPWPLSSNHYYSASAGYSLSCPLGSNHTWDLGQAQQRGLDLGSTLHTLPTTEELLSMMQALLAF